MSDQRRPAIILRSGGVGLSGTRFHPDLVEIFVGVCIAFRSRAIAIFSLRARKRTADLLCSISPATAARLKPESQLLETFIIVL